MMVDQINVCKCRQACPSLTFSLWQSFLGTRYLPPLCDPMTGHLLLDGGYCNNLPVDVMRRHFGPRIVVAVDVEAKDPKDFTNYGDACR